MGLISRVSSRTYRMPINPHSMSKRITRSSRLTRSTIIGKKILATKTKVVGKKQKTCIKFKIFHKKKKKDLRLKNKITKKLNLTPIKISNLPVSLCFQNSSTPQNQSPIKSKLNIKPISPKTDNNKSIQTKISTLKTKIAQKFNKLTPILASESNLTKTIIPALPNFLTQVCEPVNKQISSN